MSRPGYPITMVSSPNVTGVRKVAATGSIVTYSDPHLVRELFDDKVGGNTAGWPEFVTENDYERNYAEWSQAPLTVDGKQLSTGDELYGQWGYSAGTGYNPTRDSGTFGEPEIFNSLFTRLNGKLIDKIQKRRVNLGEVFATRSMASKMVADSAGRIWRSLKELKRGNVRDAIKQLTGGRESRRGGDLGDQTGRITRTVGGVPGQWLAMQYGWKPLLEDVHNSLKTVERAWSDHGVAYTVTASTHEELPYKEVFVGSPSSGWTPCISHYTVSRRISGRASCTYRIADNVGASLSQLGISNPLSIAWELLPLSFVYDWFHPVGSYLERLDFDRGIEFSHGWMTVKAKQTFATRMIRSKGLMFDYEADWSGGAGSGYAFYLVRQRMVGLPVVPVPQFKDPFSLSHVANALSLLSQMVRT